MLDRLMDDRASASIYFDMAEGRRGGELRVLETGGFRRSAVTAYFAEKGIAVDGDRFALGAVEVLVGEEVLASLGSIVVPRVSVEFRGEVSEVENAVGEFRRKFMTAGA